MNKRPDEVFLESLQATPKLAEAGPVVPKEETPERPRLVTQKNLFSHVDAHPVVLDLALLKAFQGEWFPWLPDTLFHEIELTFKTSIAEVNKTKIMATKTLHVVDAFWEEWEIFEKVVQGLNGVVPRVSVMQPPTVALLLAGVDMANSIRRESFSEEVSRYAAACFLYDNVHYAPPPLDFCQQYISRPRYACSDCGQHGSALPPFDGFCDSCTQKFTQERPFSFAPDQAQVDRGVGQKLVYSMTLDPAPVKTRFEELDKLPADGLSIQETDVDIQAAKLIVATDYRQFRTRQLTEQLAALRGWLEAA